MQRNLVLVNDLFKSKGSVADCITDRASVHAGNALEQFLPHNGTLIPVYTCTGATFETEQKPIRYSVNIASVYCSTANNANQLSSTSLLD